MTFDTAAYLSLAQAHQMPTYAAPPVVVSHGTGAQVWDTEGREYLDFAGGIGVNALGHAPPAVVVAVVAQAQRFLHTSNALQHAPGIDYAAKLCHAAGLDQAFFCNSGCEAVEAALKLARRYFFDRGTPRPKFVAVHHGFHGRTQGALAVTGQPAYQKGFAPLWQRVQFVPYDDVAALQQAVDAQTAGFIVEPILGNGGVRVPSPTYLREAQKICRDQGALLMVDEIQTGLGRTGDMFAYQAAGIVPDIVCLAKAIGGGLPLGAVLSRREIAACFIAGVHGSTFGGNPLACAAGLATLQVIESEGLLAHATAMGEHFRTALRALQPSAPQLLEVRGRGLLVGLQLDTPVKPLLQRCRSLGLLGTGAGANVLRFFPPLNVKPAQLDAAVQMVADALQM
jgi:acetylornithine/N-succinyldiaminopimelate aminotransferase